MSIFNITFSGCDRQSSSGFLLIELALTFFIVSSLGFYLCRWYSELININRESIERAEAILLACSLCDKIKISKKVVFENGKMGNFIINCDVKNYNKKFNFVEVKVSWLSYLNKENFVKIIAGYEVG